MAEAGRQAVRIDDEVIGDRKVHPSGEQARQLERLLAALSALQLAAPRPGKTGTI